MEQNKKPWPLSTVHGIRSRVDTNPDFQRPPAWKTAQKQFLIDTILQNYDIPKLYWRKVSSKPDKYDVVDGQQRLRAIWEFMDGEFRIPKDADPIDGYEVRGLQYKDLPDELRIRFDTYPLDIVVLEDTDEDEVREMFLRLQNGTSLKAQEKRNAYPGQMRAFVRSLTEHPIFQRVGFSNHRLSHDQVAAQLACLELNGGPGNVRNTDLNRMYEQGKDFDTKSTEARAIVRTLDLMAKVFPERRPELEPYNVVALYCVFSELQKGYVIQEVEGKLFDWFLGFEQTKVDEDQKPGEEASSDWRSYKEKTSHSTDSAESIRWRMDFLLCNLLSRFPTLSRKDNQRSFTDVQRQTIFRRDRGICHVRVKCSGDKLKWDDWHCDHIVSWSKGGKTTVENGQVSCTPCNESKGND